jgi:hypothetical protein
LLPIAACLAAIALLPIAACLADGDPAAEFWDWFHENAGRLSWATGSDELAQDIHRHLVAVDPGIVFELEGNPGSARTLVISANGKAVLLPVVERVVAGAPSIQGWSIVALRPRLGTSLGVSYRGFEIEPDEFWFREEGKDGELALHVYLPGVGGPEEPLAMEAAKLMLHSAVGERDALLKIRSMTRHALPEDPRSLGLLPYRDLPAVVDSY